MDFTDRFHRVRNRFRLQGRAWRLPALFEAWAARRPNERATRRLKGVFLLFTSLILGAWVYNEASSDARTSWERAHPPGLRVWEHALGSRAVLPPPKNSKVSQAQRSLPARLEQEGTAWISGDGGWVALFGAPEANPPFRLYCRTCETPPASWDPAGRGWDAFERVLTRLDQTTKPAVKRPAAPADPREIRY
jgi:hypothetical protein